MFCRLEKLQGARQAGPHHVWGGGWNSGGGVGRGGGWGRSLMWSLTLGWSSPTNQTEFARCASWRRCSNFLPSLTWRKVDYFMALFSQRGEEERKREGKRFEVKARSGLLSTLGPCEISQSGLRAATGRRAMLILSRADPAARRYGPSAARPSAKLFQSINFSRSPPQGGRDEWGEGVGECFFFLAHLFKAQTICFKQRFRPGALVMLCMLCYLLDL